MTKDQVHSIRRQLNVLQNTFASIITVEEHRIIGYDHSTKVQVAHPLVEEGMKSLRYATYWLGKLLSFQGQEAPTEEQYATAGRDDATTDTIPVEQGDVKSLHLLRAEIQVLIDIVDEPLPKEYKATRNEARAYTNVFQYLTEARFAVGELIGQLRVTEAKEVDKVIEGNTETK